MGSASTGKNIDFFKKYMPRHQSKAPKYAILREAIINAIVDGYWSEGDQLPTEVDLVNITPYSLGTVQRAVQGLVADGFITRKQGSGSFVAPLRKRIGGPWIYRFLDPEGVEFLPMYTRLLSRTLSTVNDANITRWLIGSSAREKVLVLDRIVVIAGNTNIFSRFFVNPKRFPLLVEIPARELDGTNFAGLLHHTYKTPIRHIARTASPVKLPAEICEHIDLSPGTPGLLVEIAASASQTLPIFYQQLFIPPGTPRLFISDSLDEWIGTSVSPNRCGSDADSKYA